MTTNKQAVQLNCNSTGAPGHKNLVILHGLFGDLNNWKAMARRLSDHYHVHCMDLRNHGDSPHISGMSYPAMAADVALTCAENGIENTLVIGHSMGGKTAMQLALDNSALVEKMAIVDIGPRRYENHHDSIIKGLQVLSNTALQSRQQADELMTPYAPEAGIRAFLLKNLQRTDDQHYKLRINIDEITDRYSDVADSIVSDKHYQKPVLFIKGAESNYLADADRAPIAALFSNPSLKTIDGAGHWPHSEKPEVVYKVLSDFFATG